MEKIQQEKVTEVLRQQGMVINEEQAKAIVKFLQNIAAIFVSQYIQKNIKKNCRDR